MSKAEPGLVEAANRRVAAALRKEAQKLGDEADVRGPIGMESLVRNVLANAFDDVAEELEAGTEGEGE